MTALSRVNLPAELGLRDLHDCFELAATILRSMNTQLYESEHFKINGQNGIVVAFKDAPPDSTWQVVFRVSTTGNLLYFSRTKIRDTASAELVPWWFGLQKLCSAQIESDLTASIRKRGHRLCSQGRQLLEEEEELIFLEEESSNATFMFRLSRQWELRSSTKFGVPTYQADGEFLNVLRLSQRLLHARLPYTGLQVQFLKDRKAVIYHATTTQDMVEFDLIEELRFLELAMEKVNLKFASQPYEKDGRVRGILLYG